MERLRPSRFEAFYASSWFEIYRPLAATLSDRELAAEAVDEAMARAFTRWSKVQGMANPEGWVYRVAYRWAIDQIRRRRTERRLVARMVDRASTAEPAIEPGLLQALAGLPIEQRAVVVLSSVFDWSHTQIAEVLSIQPGTVKSRLHRGIRRLRQELES